MTVTATLLAKKRLLSTLYGAPQFGTILGRLGATRAAKKVVKQARPTPIGAATDDHPGIDLIAVVANSTPGPDHRYRTRRPTS